MSESTDRTNALRELLVTQVEASLHPTRRSWRLGAVFVAVALASGATGALTAGAIEQDVPYDPNVIASLALTGARANSTVIGEPYSVASSGDAVIDLGTAPEHATGIAIRLGCTEAGSIDVSLDGVWFTSLTCDAESPTGGSGNVTDFTGAGPHTLTFHSPTGTGYEAFVAWVEEPPLPGPSAQQLSEIEDGVATREEYLAAFNRFAGCMGANGYDVGLAYTDTVILNYSIPSAAADAGVDVFCYLSQFQEVDTLWQLQNEDASETTRMMRECLSERGIAPAERTAEVRQQLEDAGMTMEECLNVG